MDPLSGLFFLDDSFDQFLIDGGDVMEDEWTASQGDALMSDSQNEELLSAARRGDQQGANPLFRVAPERLFASRPWRNGAAVQIPVRLRLEQLRDANGEVLGEAVTQAFADGIRQVIEEFNIPNPEECTLRITVHHSTGTQQWGSSGLFPVTEWRQGSERTRAWMDKLTKQLNSAESFDATSSEFYVDFLFIRSQACGSGHRGQKWNPGDLSYGDMVKKHRCIIEIKNKDELCAARAIVTSKAVVEEDPQKIDIRKGRPFQKFLAKQLHQQSGVPEGPCGQQDMKKFQARLESEGCQIIVFEGQQGTIWFKDRRLNHCPKKILLLKVQQHFHTLTKVPALLNRSYYCHHCEKGYNTEVSEKHNCQGQNCRACKRTNKTCPNFAAWMKPQVYCQDCNRTFYGQNCYDAHKRRKGNYTLCQQLVKCRECCKEYKPERKKKHVCWRYFCRNCEEEVFVDHPCYMQPIPEKEKKNGLRTTAESEEEEEMIAFEEEDSGEGEGADDSEKKAPPLICAIDFECTTDANQQFEDIRVGWQYIGRDAGYREAGTAQDLLKDVLDHTITADKKERDVFVYAHNMRGFDSSFILNNLYDQGYKVEKILSMGAKYLSFQRGNVIFRDSLNFFNMPLEKLPATFNLKELHKGFFPYSWIKPANYSYVGSYPPMEDYHPDRMNEKRRKEFMTWYKQKVESGEIFDFQKELSAYLKSDVQVLAGALETFGEEMEALTGINPNVECVTAASMAMRTFRKINLEPNLIAIEPQKGWRTNQQNQSLEAIQWLEFQNFKRGGGIRHVRNSLQGEVRILTPAQRYNVDGYEEATKTVFEYHGCIYHGCMKCFPQHRHHTRHCHPDRTVEEVYEATLLKTSYLRECGYTVIEKWGCEFKKDQKTDPELKSFLEEFEIVAPLEPRDAFFGGRTGATTLYAKAEGEGEDISYVDYTSLYPWVNKYGIYPVHFPVTIFNPEDQDIFHYFGIAKVDILAPELLFHPVLPVREGGKLTFPLCRSCVREEMPKPMLERSNLCGHTREQRMLRGTWCTLELQKAVEMGYEMIKIHEVFHFEEDDRRTGLFADYVNTWLKLKQESAGWPAECVTPEQKAAYVQEYEEVEGIKLEHVAENPGRKAIAKILLNSLWGKFGERQNKPKTHCITQPSELFQLLDDPTVLISNVRICSEDVMEVVTTTAEDEYERSFTINVFIAVFTTAQARLKLYEALETLQERVLYYDTDSVIYKTKAGQAKLPLGNFLGQFTDELEGDSIVEFVSGGAKNYAYRTKKGKVECKVRGFSLNYENKQILNFYTMKDNILKELDEPLEERRTMTVPVRDFFERNQTTKKIKLTQREKKYGLVFDKRVIDRQTRVSTPYGYSWIGQEAELLADLL